MPSENEIVDPSGDNPLGPDTEVQPLETMQPETEPLETAVVDNTPVEPEPEPLEDDDLAAEEEMDWDSWLLSSPEAEEFVPVLAPAQELEAYLLNGEDSFTDEDFDDEAVDDKDSDDEDVDDEDVPVTELVEIVAEVAAVTAVDETPAQADEREAEFMEMVAQTAVAETASEADEFLVDVPVPPPAKPKTPKKKHPHGLTEKDVIRYFAACARCGYFLTGYRAAYGEDNFETAVSEEKGGWLTLSWGGNLPGLIEKSYGVVVETNDLLFNNCCLECRRALVYNGLPDADKPATFRIEVKPRER